MPTVSEAYDRAGWASDKVAELEAELEKFGTFLDHTDDAAQARNLLEDALQKFEEFQSAFGRVRSKLEGQKDGEL